MNNKEGKNQTPQSNQEKSLVDWFRHSAPYINAHRGHTFVLMIPGEAIQHQNFSNIVHDIALLNSLGVRLVIAFGARPQIAEKLQAQGIKPAFHASVRITDEAALVCVKEAVGALRIEIEALLSMGLANSPMHRSHIDVCSGNYITAKPKGIIDGIDYHHTGEVRRIDTEAINKQLNNGAVIVMPSIGYSPTGETFNLSLSDVATQAAIQLNANKLVVFCDTNINDNKGNLIKELSIAAARDYQETLTPDDALFKAIHAACNACHSGVNRSHLINLEKDGALIEELFTLDGSGTLLAQKSYETIRLASIDDVGGIIELIDPLEQQGVLVKRSRELLESEITRFTVVERDGTIIACAALYPFEELQAGELACVVTHPDYRKGNRASRLLDHIEQQARELSLQQLYVLTTQTSHWFIEKGFSQAELSVLPTKKQQLYNLQRNSKILVKAL